MREMSAPNKLLPIGWIIGLLIGLIGLVFLITGIATPYWLSGETQLLGTNTYHGGLWKRCLTVDITGTTSCTALKFGEQSGRHTQQTQEVGSMLV